MTTDPKTAQAAQPAVAPPSDDRLKKDPAGTSDDARLDRAMIDRAVTQSREISEDERLEMFRAKMYADILPDLPPIPGYHLCWLTTTNRSDPIQRRIQLGYTPVTQADAPGMDYATLKTGEYVGMIGVNEMLAFKLPLSLYYKYMNYSHHEQPLSEERSLASQIDAHKESAEAAGGRIDEGEGMADLRRSHPAQGGFSSNGETFV